MKEKLYCKKCGGFINFNQSVELLSSPAQYRGKCTQCDEMHYINTSDFHAAVEEDNE